LSECLGIDLGDQAVTLAVVSRAKTGASIRAFERREYPPDAADPAARAAFAARAVIDSPFARLPIALSLPGTDVFMRPVTVPFTKKSHIAGTLKFELEGVLFFDVETAVIDFTILSSAQGSTKLLIAAMPESALALATAPFEEAGLRLQHVTADALSSCALAHILGEKDFALLDVGLTGWSLSVCAGGELQFARAAKAAPANGSMEATVGGWYKQGIVAAPGVVAPKVYITGEGARQFDLKLLSDCIGVPAEALSYGGAAADGEIAAGMEDLCRTGAAAVNAAAEHCYGSDFDFYAVARGRQSLVDRAFAPVVIGLVAATLLLGAVGWDSLHKARSMRASTAEVARAQASIWQGLFPGQKPREGDVHSSLTAAVNELDQGVSDEVKGGSAAPVLAALTAIAKSVPQGQKVTFKVVDAREGRVVVTAYAPEPRMEETIVAAINKGGTFKATSTGRTGENQQWKFDITMNPMRLK
jgi:hypothetical protein